jgi:hypothetical protein
MAQLEFQGLRLAPDGRGIVMVIGVMTTGDSTWYQVLIHRGLIGWIYSNIHVTYLTKLSTP